MVLEERLEEKIKIIDEIFQSYLIRDIAFLLRVERVDAFSSLIKMLASQASQLINYSTLASGAGISIQTVKNYIWYAEKTFIIYRLLPYFKNLRKEIVKSPTIYFSDLGLRNYSLGLFGNLSNPKDLSLSFQNYISNILKEKMKYTNSSLHFWRTQDKAEVDFVICSGKNTVPLEVKYREFTKVEINRSLRSFIEKYRPKKAFIVNLNLREKVNISHTEVIFLPFWELFKLGPFFS